MFMLLLRSYTASEPLLMKHIRAVLVKEKDFGASDNFYQKGCLVKPTRLKHNSPRRNWFKVGCRFLISSFNVLSG